MTTIEDKISLFSKIIYDKVNEEKEEKLEAFRVEAEKKINVEKENIEALRRSLRRDVTKKSNVKANGLVAKERLNKQREMLFLKDKLIGEALENVRQKLEEFVSTPKYKSYFLSLLEKFLKEMDSEKYFIIVMKRDYQRFQNEIEVILSDYGDRNVDIKISEEDFIGGIIMKDFQGKFKIDSSLFSKLQESKEIIGVRVMEMLA